MTSTYIQTMQHDWNHRRLTCFQPDTFSFGGQMGTGVVALLGGEAGTVCTEGPDLLLGYWGGEHSDPRLLDECAIPTSRQNLLHAV